MTSAGRAAPLVDSADVRVPARARSAPASATCRASSPPTAWRWVKLNTNELPLPRRRGVRRRGRGRRRRSTATRARRRSHCAARWPRTTAVEPAQVAVGNGADALIDDCLRAFCEPGTTVVLTDPTYSLLPVAARLHGARPQAVAAATATAASRTSSPRRTAPLRFVVNPNTPTGTWIEPDAAGRDSRRRRGRGRHRRGVLRLRAAVVPSRCWPATPAGWCCAPSRSRTRWPGCASATRSASADLIADLRAVGESYPVDRCAIAGALSRAR